MDNQRLLIWGFFGLMVWMTYQTWVMDYAPKPVTPPQETSTLSPPQGAAPAATPGIDDDLPEIEDPNASAALPAVGADSPASSAVASLPTIRVTTDVLDIEISTRGGTLQKAAVLKYPVAKDRPDTVIQMLSTDPAELGLIESGVRSASGGAEATHLSVFQSERDRYELGAADDMVVVLSWSDPGGISVEKRYHFAKGSYKIELEQIVSNGSDELWRGAEYARIKRYSRAQERSMFDVDSYSFAGPIIYDGEKAQKLKRDDLLDDGSYTFYSAQGWIGAIQHHFVSAVVPPRGVDYKYDVSVSGDVSTSTMIGADLRTIAPGSNETFATTLFVGPKLQSQLEEIDKTLKLTVDYGWLTIISQPLFWLLSLVHGFVGNWGLAIIIVTFLIKLAFYKLTESSGRSMAKMRNLQPRMKALQDRYKDDRQALSQAMMDLYKREKVNPAAGCLPILIQMPFFLAFYWVLLESVEMRQAPFALWITDLSTRDPYFILPLIMGAAMFMQQKLNPAPADPVQAKVMQIMPIMFTVFFAFFPSGLVLYWVTNTLLSIAQQWKINTVVEAEAKQQKSGKKKQKAD
jgi:YidC/Oxa1 family membrane protein insertase